MLREVNRCYENHFHADLLVAIKNAYPNQPEYVDALATWITAPGFP